MSVRSLGAGGAFLLPADPNDPACVFVCEQLGIEAEAGEMIEYRLCIVTSERKQREHRRYWAQCEADRKAEAARVAAAAQKEAR